MFPPVAWFSTAHFIISSHNSSGNTAVRPLYIIAVLRGERVSVLVHRQAEGYVLPKGTHIALPDPILNKGGDLIEGCPRNSVLGNIHGPGLDCFPYRTGEVQLDYPLRCAEIGPVDRSVVDGQQVGRMPLLSSSPMNHFASSGWVKPSALPLFGADLPELDLKI